MNDAPASIFTILVVAELPDDMRRLDPVLVAATNQAEAVQRWLAQHERDHYDAPGAPPPDAFIERVGIVSGGSDPGIVVHSDRKSMLVDQAGYDAWLESAVRSDEDWEFIGYAIENLETGDVSYATQCPSTKALLRQGLSEWRVTQEWGSRRLVSHAEDDGSSPGAPCDTPCLEHYAPMEHFTERA